MKEDGPSADYETRTASATQPSKQYEDVDMQPSSAVASESVPGAGDEGMEVDDESRQSRHDNRYSSDRRGHERERDLYPRDAANFQDGRYGFSQSYGRLEPHGYRESRESRDHREHRSQRGYYQDDYRRSERYR